MSGRPTLNETKGVFFRKKENDSTQKSDIQKNDEQK